MSTAMLVTLGIGALLLWAGIRGENPLTAIKNVLTTGDVR